MSDRLDKRVAHWCSLPRKRARQLIRQGRVRIGDQTVRDAGAPIDNEPLWVDAEKVTAPIDHAAFHKPVGVQCTVGDPMGRRSLQEAASELLALGLHPVGRLDADTSGLLLFTRHGALTQRLLHPRHAVAKTYQATVEGVPTQATVDALQAGVQTAVGVHTASDVHIDQCTITLTVTEGKHRMVRRMLANTGHPVITLQRLRMGDVDLGTLARGAWRGLSDAEQAWCAALTGGL